MLKVKQFAFNDFAELSYVIYNDSTREAIVVDPGMSNPAEDKLFDDYIDNNRLTITHIVNTHLHLDHCCGDAHVATRYHAPVAAHSADAPLGASIATQAQMFGVSLPEGVSCVTIDRPLKDGDTISLDPYTFTVMEVPGHSPGGIALYCAEAQMVIVGDSIFRGSIGRTDLPGGNHAALIDALRRRILSLPGDTRILPGHGSITTVADELAHNPYV